MSRGTIIYVGNFELPDKNAAANRVMNNGKIFRALGYRVVYLGTVRDELFNGVRLSDYDENIFEEAYPTTTKLWIKHVFSANNVENVAKSFTDVCLVIVYNLPYATYKAIKRAFRNIDIKIAYDCTEWNNYAEGSFLKRLYKRIDEFEIRFFLGKKTDNLIVISEMMKNQYSRSNVIKLPPLVDSSESIWHQAHMNHPESFEFCFAGTITNKERLDIIVKAICDIDDPRLRLRVIGLSKEEYFLAYPEHQDLVNDNNRVLFMGKLSHSRTIQYTLSCDCYIFIRELSRKNMAGFPTKFAEAYTCGVPIISTDVSDIKQYASDDRSLIIDDTSDNTVKDAMLHMLSMNASKDKEKELNKSFDYHHYLGETEEWISRIR